MKPLYRVLWDNEAKAALKSIIVYIKQDPPAAAQKVKQALLQLAASLEQMPDRFSAEPYLAGKPGNYRSVSKWNYKIIYRVTEQEVLILDIFHTGKNPIEIEEIA
ncbi:MAG: type II toxin-antitoxin system RelE/ParE family toxin [Adhaeribacter sp.]